MTKMAAMPIYGVNTGKKNLFPGISGSSSMKLGMKHQRFKLIIFCSNDTLHVRERLRTHKVFTYYQYFYLNYHNFSIKSYVLDVY